MLAEDYCNLYLRRENFCFKQHAWYQWIVEILILTFTDKLRVDHKKISRIDFKKWIKWYEINSIIVFHVISTTQDRLHAALEKEIISLSGLYFSHLRLWLIKTSVHVFIIFCKGSWKERSVSSFKWIVNSQSIWDAGGVDFSLVGTSDLIL